MTELHDLYTKDKETFKAKLRELDTDQLFAELDDTIQFDILQANNVEWANMHSEKAVYHEIVKLLQERISQ